MMTMDLSTGLITGQIPGSLPTNQPLPNVITSDILTACYAELARRYSVINGEVPGVKAAHDAWTAAQAAEVQRQHDAATQIASLKAAYDQDAAGFTYDQNFLAIYRQFVPIVQAKFDGQSSFVSFTPDV